MSIRNLVGFVYNPTIPDAPLLIESLVDKLNLQDSSWVNPSTQLKLPQKVLLETKAIISAGGDGTILKVVRIAAPNSIPILGINLGRVGFMTELTVAEATDKIPDYLFGDPRIEKRVMLQASLTQRSREESHNVFHALNDVVVARGSTVSLLDIETSIDDVPFATYRADGVIAATPTGSTGYALSAGGPILHPEANEILLQPIASHISFQTGIVIPSSSVIKLGVNVRDNAVLSIDGSTDTQINHKCILTIQISPYSALFMRRNSPAEFYKTMTQRLDINSG